MINFPIKVTIAGIDELTAPLRKMRREIDKNLRPLRDGMKDLRVHAKALASASGLDKVGSAFGNVLHRAGEVGHEFKHVALEVLAGATAASLGIFELVHSYAESGAEVLRTAKKFGVGTDTLQEWRYAAKRAHVESDVLDAALAKLSVNLGQARFGRGAAFGTLQLLGIRIFDANHKLRTLGSLLPEIADKLNSLRDPGLRALYTFQLFGKNWKELAPVLALGSEEIAKLGARAKDLGLILTEDDLEAAHEFEESWKDIKDAVLGVRNAAARELIPVLTELARDAVKWISDNREEIRKFVHDFAAELPGYLRDIRDGMKALLPLAEVLLGFIKSVSELIGPVNTGLLLLATTIGFNLTKSVLALIPALGQLSVALLTTPAGWVISMLAGIVVAYTDVGLELRKLRNEYKLTWGEIVEGFLRVEWNLLLEPVKLVGRVLKWEFDLIKSLWDSLPEFFAGVLERIGSFFKNAATDVRGELGWALDPVGMFSAWLDVPAFFTKVWADIKAPFSDGFSFVKDRVGELQDALLPDWLKSSGPSASRPAVAGGTVKPAPGPASPASASLRVDFSNMPRGVRVTAQKTDGLALDLRQGYTMVAQ